MKSPGSHRWVIGTVVASTVVMAGAAAGTALVKPQAGPAVRAVSSAASPSAPTAGEETVDPVTEPAPVDRDALLADALAGVQVPDGVRLSVGVLDVASGESATFGEDSFDTASIVKVDILATLLLQAQDADRGLTATEKSYATTMIEQSDNDSASALWRTIGEAAGLDAANVRFGLTGTKGSDGATWGLTQTTAADQLTLLQQVFGDGSELSAESQTYLQGLMEEIAADQHWGVSAVADGSSWALKNGWLPRTATGLWDINSVGRVTVAGREFLVAVLSDGNASQAKGISLVEAAARVAVTAFGAEPEATASGAAAAAAG
ncbi:serine hydrolase [Streptomyces sp. NPDC088387]|uniref:serine hydrolase n=1 Tax=Streptomyces sp. NPDC088387 TaxID=3365859 RepID=UPI003801A134